MEYQYDLIQSYSEKGLVIIMGDTNCHVNSGRTSKCLDSRDLLFKEFLDINKLTTVTSLDSCSGSIYTCGSSIIDHIILPNGDIDVVTSSEIFDDNATLVCNHHPVFCHVPLPVLYNPTASPSCSRLMTWSHVSKDLKILYTYFLESDIGLKAILDLEVKCNRDIFCTT